MNPTSSKAGRPRSVSNSARKYLTALLLLMADLPAQAEVAGTVTHLSGTLVAQHNDGTGKTLSVNSEFTEDVTLATQSKTYARVKFKDGSEVVLRPNTRLAIDRYSYKSSEPSADSVIVGLLKGGLRMVTGLLGKRSPDQVKVKTPTATIGIRGTHFGLLMCQEDCSDIPTASGNPPQEGLHIDVADGLIQVTNASGQQLIGAGQFGYVQSKDTPPVLVPPSQGIQVTMPANISQDNTAGRSVGKDSGNSECLAQ